MLSFSLPSDLSLCLRDQEGESVANLEVGPSRLLVVMGGDSPTTMKVQWSSELLTLSLAPASRLARVFSRRCNILDAGCISAGLRGVWIGRPDDLGAACPLAAVAEAWTAPRTGRRLKVWSEIPIGPVRVGFRGGHIPRLSALDLSTSPGLLALFTTIDVSRAVNVAGIVRENSMVLRAGREEIARATIKEFFLGRGRFNLDVITEVHVSHFSILSAHSLLHTLSPHTLSFGHRSPTRRSFSTRCKGSTLLPPSLHP